MRALRSERSFPGFHCLLHLEFLVHIIGGLADEREVGLTIASGRGPDPCSLQKRSSLVDAIASHAAECILHCGVPLTNIEITSLKDNGRAKCRAEN